MEDTKEIIFKSLDILDKLMEKKEPPAEESDMGGGSPQEQLTEQQVEHDHEGHFAWYHEHMMPLWCGLITTVGLVVVAWLGYRNRKSKG